MGFPFMYHEEFQGNVTVSLELVHRDKQEVRKASQASNGEKQ